MKKNTVIHARCTDEEKNRIEKRAEKAGLTSSEYIVQSVLKSRTRLSSAGKDMTRTITQFQAGINEIALDIEKMSTVGLKNIDNLKEKIEEVQEGLDELWRLLK